MSWSRSPLRSRDSPTRREALIDLNPNRGPGTRWTADRAWLEGTGLTSDVTFEVRGGFVTDVLTEQTATGERLSGTVVPGLVNAHSHAFHRLLRGRTHRQGGDFWLWRERMYEVAASLSPETYERLATAVYVEMALAGVTAVGEFHYLHHQPGGARYADPNEMGHALVRAARTAGIRITLLDAGYFAAGFDERPVHPVQSRFSDGTVEAWLERFAALDEAYRDAEDVAVGLAPHSVRAVPAAHLTTLSREWDGKAPIHIHVSEQPAENRDCVAATGLTPVGLLSRSGLLGPATTLVHATHVTEEDLGTIADAGPGVCYCPTTERDLGDGLGPASELAAAGTRICVGSDSHAVIDLFEETRGVELHARLATGRRGVFSSPDLLDAATRNGSASLGLPSAALTPGAAADFAVVDTSSPRLAGLGAEPDLDQILFAATASDVVGVFIAGREVVAEGRHPAWDETRPILDELAPGQ